MQRLAEGLAIVKQTLAELPPHKARPALAAPPPAAPEPEPEEEPIDHLTPRERHHVNGVVAMLRLARITAKPGLKRACYRDAGVYLARLRRDRPKAEWAEILREDCGLSVSRAYDLMAVAEGKKRLDQLRAETAARRRKHYQTNQRLAAKGRPPEAGFAGVGTRKNAKKIKARKL
jgi:hypothetical protein